MTKVVGAAWWRGFGTPLKVYFEVVPWVTIRKSGHGKLLIEHIQKIVVFLWDGFVKVSVPFCLGMDFLGCGMAKLNGKDISHLFHDTWREVFWLFFYSKEGEGCVRAGTMGVISLVRKVETSSLAVG